MENLERYIEGHGYRSLIERNSLMKLFPYDMSTKQYSLNALLFGYVLQDSDKIKLNSLLIRCFHFDSQVYYQLNNCKSQVFSLLVEQGLIFKEYDRKIQNQEMKISELCESCSNLQYDNP